MSPLPRARCTADAPARQGPCTDDARDEAWARAGDAARDAARSRLRTAVRAEALAAEGLSRAEADARAAGEAGVSPATVARWRSRVRRLPPGERVAALLDGPRTGRPGSISGAALETLEALAFNGGPHLTARHARRTLEARFGEAPSEGHLRRWLAAWRAEHAGELSAATHPDRHRSHRMPAFGAADAGAERPNQLWELDSTLADIMFSDGRRRALVAGVDVWSRRARFLVAETSRSTAIAALLRRCILDWGVPETARTDEGRDYTSRHVTGVLQDLEVAIDLCPPYRPDMKPFVERVIGTVSRDLFANLPGFTGHSPAEAEALRSRKSFAARRGQDAATVLESSLTPEDLQRRLDTWCDALYGRRAHSGLGGASPFDRARAWTGPVRRVRNERALDALLAVPASGKGKRVVGKKGLRVDSGVYIAAELGPRVGDVVRVRLDPTDAGRVHVYEHREDKPLGEFICVAEDPLRTGIDRAEVAARARALAGEADRVARARARDLDRRHRPAEAMDEVLERAAAAAGKVVALPRKGEAHETPALAGAARAAEASREKNSEAPARTGRRRLMAAHRRLYLEEEAG